MKRNVSLVSLILVLMSLAAPLVLADVGVGAQPSKIRQAVESGSIYETSVLVFNSGDNEMDISVTPEGEIAAFAEVTPQSYRIEPEPKPHTLPAKYGKMFTVKFNVPLVRKPITYRGTLSAIGNPATGSQ